MNFIKNLIFSSLLIFTFGCAKENITKMENGLIIEDIIIGEGEEAKKRGRGAGVRCGWAGGDRPTHPLMYLTASSKCGSEAATSSALG